ncbi:hypothetical protein AB0J83_09640 [Actinoplanes sp. NPDC049596]|uniref:hypothetical protein n=1 Tax=unclassified Actinoplanes TaxID=2626549 RepID=UPI003438107E
MGRMLGMHTDLSIARIPAAVTALTGLVLVTGCAAEALPAASAPSSPAVSVAPAPSSPTPAPSPSASSSSSGGVFSGTRQVYLLPKNSESGLAVLKDGKVGLSEAFDDTALFVLTRTSPERDQYWIRTAKLRKGGEPLCLSAKLTGGKPAPVTTVACDAAATDQLFRFREVGESNGKPTYTIYTGRDTFIIQDPTGEIAHTGNGVAAVTIGEGTPDIDTAFVLPDKGKASMPALD